MTVGVFTRSVFPGEMASGQFATWWILSGLPDHAHDTPEYLNAQLAGIRSLSCGDGALTWFQSRSRR